MDSVVRRGGVRRTCEGERLLGVSCKAAKEELMDMERFRWARARLAATVSGEGGSPKMKNLIKAPMSITTESWPRRNPSVNDSLWI